MSLPTYWGWCGCTVWPLVFGVNLRRCGRCGRQPIYVADDIHTTPGGITREQAEHMVAAGEVEWAW